MPRGRIASTAKYHRKYQSGRGEAMMIVGSGGFPSGLGPTMSASASTVPTTSTATTASRQAASGQNGCPSRSSRLRYQAR